MVRRQCRVVGVAWFITAGMAIAVVTASGAGAAGRGSEEVVADAQAMVAYCTSCGKPVPKGAKFCPSCGAEQAHAEAAAAPEDAVLHKGKGGAEPAAAAQSALRQGDAAYRAKRWEDAIRHYVAAYEIDHVVAANQEYLDHIVQLGAFRTTGDAARDLMKDLGGAIIPVLKRAQSATGNNYWLRHKSAESLQALGAAADWVAVYMADLQYCTSQGADEEIDEDRREAAADQLGRLRDRRAIGPLKHCAAHDDDHPVREHCEDALEVYFNISM
ncbi:MAG: zinc-ribbon domain-containing protein [Candidatus Schekmanbacteria bacterium]|nr:zinc-ribbon domain-containing protein [Candidatus Schekmanbacteria bacterium]